MDGLWWLGGYIKKEDAPKSFKGVRIYYLVVSIAMFIVPIVFYGVVTPKVDNLLEAYSIARPLTSYVAQMLLVLGILCSSLASAYVFFSDKVKREFESKLAKYHDGEMINLNELFGPWLIRGEAIILLAMGLIVGFAVWSYLSPIYQITSVAK
jgi:hypothetical protein